MNGINKFIMQNINKCETTKKKNEQTMTIFN